MTNISFWDRLVPYVHKQQDAPEKPFQTLIEATQQEMYILKDEITNLYNLWDIDNCPDNYLVYLANLLGCQIEACDPPSIIREQIRNANVWYKLKGSVSGFVVCMRMLGYDVTIKRLFELTPDGDYVEEDVAITGFNTRLPGYHAGSRINVYLERSEFAKNLHLCGDGVGLLTDFFTKRIKQKFEECKPIHIDASLIIVKSLEDYVVPTDSLLIAPEVTDVPSFLCCCYHGKGSQVIDATYLAYDTGYVFDTSYYFDDIVGGKPRRVYDSPMGMPILWDFMKIYDVPDDPVDNVYHQFDRDYQQFDADNNQERTHYDRHYKFDTPELDVTKYDTYVYNDAGTALYVYIFYDDIEYDVTYPVCRRDGAVTLRRDGWTIIDNPTTGWVLDTITGNITLPDAHLIDREVLVGECVRIPYDITITEYLYLEVLQVYTDNQALVAVPTSYTLPPVMVGTGYAVMHIQSIFWTSGYHDNADGEWLHNFKVIGCKRDCCGLLDELTISTV